MSKKKVLFVVPFLPYPLTSGGHQGIFNGLLSVADSVDIYLTYPELYDQSEERQQLIKEFNGKITIVPYLDHQDSRGEHFLNWIYKTKYSIKMMIKGKKTIMGNHSPYQEWLQLLLPQSEGYIKYVNDLIQEYSIDIVQCEMIQSLAFVLSIPKNIRTIFIHHEIGFIKKSLDPFLQEEPLAGQAHLEINRLIEVNLLNLFDTVVTLSPTDTKKLQDAGVHTNLFTSFSVVNTPAERNLESSDYGVLSFIGPEWHNANREGLFWFLNHCWDSLVYSKNGYSLQIIGNWSKETQRFIERRFKNVHFLGYVDNLASALHNSIMIVPINMGSGIRMKILEACMIGVPVVTTSVGMEGLPLVNGENCFIADTPNQFVDSIVALSDASLRKLFITRAQETIKEQYSLHALKKNREVLYTESSLK